MADFHTTNNEEFCIDRLRKDGFGYKSPDFSDNDFPKYLVLRVALAKALQSSKIALNSPQWDSKRLGGEKGKEYHLEQLTGKGKEKKEDFDMLTRSLLYIQHKDELERDNIDIFGSDKDYTEILSKYIRRGLYEIYHSWKNNDCIYQWCLDNLALQTIQFHAKNEDENAPSATHSYFERLQKYFRQFAININLVNEEDSYRHHICKIELTDSSKIQHFENKSKYLDKELGQMVLIEAVERMSRTYNIQIAKPQEQWQNLGMAEFEKGLAELKRHDFKLGIYAGNDIDKKPLCFDLAKAPHCFVAGATRGGKSVFLKSIILCLLHNQNTEIIVIDQAKDGLDFKVFNPKIRLITDFEQIQLEVENLIEEMNERYKKMSEMSNDDIVALGFSYKVIIVDELKDLIDQESKQNKEISDNLGRLAQKARAAGIHLVLATQRPDGHSFKGTLRTNIVGRIAFKVPKEADSKIILDEKGAEKLLGNGDMLVKMAGMSKPKHIFSCLLQQNDIKSLI